MHVLLLITGRYHYNNNTQNRYTTFTSSPITPGSVPLLPAPRITYSDHVHLLLLKDTAEALADGQLHIACREMYGKQYFIVL